VGQKQKLRYGERTVGKMFAPVKAVTNFPQRISIKITIQSSICLYHVRERRSRDYTTGCTWQTPKKIHAGFGCAFL